MSEWVMIIFFVAASTNSATIQTVEFGSELLCQAAIPAVIQAGTAIVGGGVGRTGAFCVERNHFRVTKQLRDVKRKA